MILDCKISPFCGEAKRSHKGLSLCEQGGGLWAFCNDLGSGETIYADHVTPVSQSESVSQATPLSNSLSTPRLTVKQKPMSRMNPSPLGQPPITPQSQLQPEPSMQSQHPSLRLSVIQLASHEIEDMQVKLQQVEVRIKDTHKRQLEAAQAGDTDEANKQSITLSRQVAAYRKGSAYVEQVLYAKRLVAEAQVQAEGSSQPPHDSANDPGTSQSQNPMSGMNQSPLNIDFDSGASTSAGPAASASAALLQASGHTATQTPPQVSIGVRMRHQTYVSQRSDGLLDQQPPTSVGWEASDGL